MWSPLNWLASILALPDDDEVMVKRKKVLVWYLLITTALGIAGRFTTGFQTAHIGAFIIAFVNGSGLIWLFVNKKPSDTFIELVGYADIIAIIFVDLNAMGAMTPRIWACSILVVDIMLVCRIRSRSSIIVIITLCLWLFITTAEEISRFGLLDSPFQFNGDHEYRFLEVCHCNSMPCKRPAVAAALKYLIMCAIFLLDFYFTRGFANEVLAEKRKLELGVLAARDVASFLAGFKLEEASLTLANSKDNLPDKLHEALHTILVNLRSYKPYLPESCLDRGFSSDEESTFSQTQSHSVSESQTATSVLSESVAAVRVLTASRVTMLVMNMKNSIKAAEADHAEFSRHHAKVIGFALHAVRAQKGMLDLFVGDHVHASFNASKRCMQHAVAAVKTATAMKRAKVEQGMEVNVAVCGGKVLVGDLGNNEVRRFSIMGNTAVLTSVYERLGAEWGIGVVCNTAAYMDASVTQEMRIILKAVTFVKHTEEKEAVLWEAMISADSATPPITPSAARPSYHGYVGQGQEMDQEWMYALDESRAKYWVKYNEAAKLYLQGRCDHETQHLLMDYTNEPFVAALSNMIAKKLPVQRRKQIY